MAFNINQLLSNPQTLQSLSSEYICTAYMFEVDEAQETDLELSEFMGATVVETERIMPPAPKKPADPRLASPVDPRAQSSRMTSGTRPRSSSTGGRY